jgi:aspartyl-tRNA(Asn)/glutamyl-tRNA(Gln) amidotransferase subunit B
MRRRARDGWEVVVGLEVHAQLATAHKLFTPAPARFAPDAPNTHVTPYCVGLPGVLPRLNEEAVRFALRVALSLGCTVHEESRFDRKHYVYPDLPKGYQITQAAQPLATSGRLQPPEGSEIRVARLHLEEDAAKIVDLGDGRAGVDFNRAGVPLVEIVTEPDLRSGAHAAAALRELRAILLTLGVSDGSLERGSLRCDANVSVRREGDAALGVRCEIKNVSGFRFVAQAIEAEADRQIAARLRGEPVIRETRGFDPKRRATHPLRTKEEQPDYRYLPEPDLPALRLAPATISIERQRLPELPSARRARWRARGLPAEHAATFAADPALSDLVDRAVGDRGERLVSVGNLVKVGVLRRVAEDRHALDRIAPESLRRLVDLERDGRISKTQQKGMLDALLTGRAPTVDAALDQAGGELVRDERALGAWVDDVLAAHPDEVAAYRQGKLEVLGHLVGRVMKRSSGRAEPKAVRQLLRARLDE